MKKLYTLIGAALVAGSLSAQIYESQDFETSLAGNGWTTQLPTANDSTDWYQDDFSGNSYAKISNYYSSISDNVPAESWLISPAIDLSGSTDPVLTFQTVMRYAGPALQLLVSNDYDGTSDPTGSSFNWTDLTSQATWDTDDSQWGYFSDYNSGDVDLAAFKTTGVYIAFVYTGTANDGSTWEIDNILVAESGTSTSPDASIYDIQNSSGASALDGQTVNTGGICSYVTGDGNYYLQSGTGPFSGIYVYDAGQTIAIGDSVTMTAQVAEYYDQTQLTSVSNFTVVSSGNSFAATEIMTNEIATEEYESVFVSVCGQCTAEEGQFADWTLNDGTGNGAIDNYLANYHPTSVNITPPTMNTYYTVQGIVNYSFSEFKLVPRANSDVNISADNCGGQSVAENFVNYSIYPNPANENVTLDVVGNHVLNVTDMTGKVIEVINVNGLTNISLANYTAGIYFFNIEGNVTKVIVK